MLLFVATMVRHVPLQAAWLLLVNRLGAFGGGSLSSVGGGNFLLTITASSSERDLPWQLKLPPLLKSCWLQPKWLRKLHACHTHAGATTSVQR